jgi:hypothetical protein
MQSVPRIQVIQYSIYSTVAQLKKRWFFFNTYTVLVLICLDLRVPWRNVPGRNVLERNVPGWNVPATERPLWQNVPRTKYPFGTDSPSQIFFSFWQKGQNVPEILGSFCPFWQNTVQGSSRGAGAAQRMLLKCCKRGRRHVYNRKCVRNQNARFSWVRDVLSEKIVPSFIFRDGQSVPENGDVWSQICRRCFVQGLFCPKDCFAPRTVLSRDVSLQNFWDEKSIGRFGQERFGRVPYKAFKFLFLVNHSTVHVYCTVGILFPTSYSSYQMNLWNKSCTRQKC